MEELGRGADVQLVEHIVIHRKSIPIRNDEFGPHRLKTAIGSQRAIDRIETQPGLCRFPASSHQEVIEMSTADVEGQQVCSELMARTVDTHALERHFRSVKEMRCL